MQTAPDGVPQGSDRFDHVESLLARYPEISAEEVDDLKSWFNKEASAFEVASLASKERLYGRYTAFRAAHVDPLKLKDYAIAGAVVLTAAAGFVYLAM